MTVGSLLLTRCRWVESLPYAEKAMDIASNNNNVDLQPYLAAAVLLSECLFRLQRGQEAEELIKKVLSTCRRKGYEDDDSVAELFSRLGVILCDRGRYTEAVSHLERTMTIEKARIAGDEWSELMAGTAYHLANTYEKLGRLDDARNLDMDILDAAKPNASSFARIGEYLWHDAGNLPQAEKILRQGWYMHIWRLLIGKGTGVAEG